MTRRALENGRQPSPLATLNAGGEMSGCLPSESMIAQFLYRYKRRTEYLNYGGDIIYSWAAD